MMPRGSMHASISRPNGSEPIQAARADPIALDPSVRFPPHGKCSWASEGNPNGITLNSECHHITGTIIHIRYEGCVHVRPTRNEPSPDGLFRVGSPPGVYKSRGFKAVQQGHGLRDRNHKTAKGKHLGVAQMPVWGGEEEAPPITQ